MSDTYYLSSTAYNRLRQIAKENGFVKFKAIRTQGMSLFLEKLAFSKFHDTRPEWAIQQHNMSLAREVRPKWSLNNERKIPHRIHLSDEALSLYVAAAIDTGVFINRRLANGGRIVNTPVVIVSSFLEALGIGWVTADSIPFIEEKDMTNGRIQPVARKPRNERRKTEIPEENPYYIYLRRGTRRSKNNSARI